jgi:hypothetical protein
LDLNSTIEEINYVLTKRKEEEELEGVLRLVIENNSRNEDELERLSRDRGVLQEKAKLVSKEIQKVKSNVMKRPNISIADRSHINGLLKPAELAIG